MFTIDQHSRQPIYEQLKEQIIRYVSLGGSAAAGPDALGADFGAGVGDQSQYSGENLSGAGRRRHSGHRILKKVFLSAIRMCIPFYIRGKKKNSARR